MQKSEKPFISVIVPTFRDWPRLQLCLNCLSQQTYPQRGFEIVVVNNDPEDRPPADLQCPENCILIEEDGHGSYAARNKALKVVRGDIVAFTDSDCLPDKQWIESAVKIFLSDESISRIGGEVQVFSVEGNSPDIALPYESLFALEQTEFVKNGAAITANMFTRKEVIEAVGGFDASLKSGGDAEWGYRAQHAGFSIIFSSLVRVQHPARSFQELLAKNKRIVGGAYDMASKKGYVAIAALYFVTLSPPVFSIYRAFRTEKLTFVEKLKAILVKVYLRLISVGELTKLLFGKTSERS